MVRPGSVDGGTGSMDRSPLRTQLLKDNRVPSVLGTPKRHTLGAERTDLTAIMAKLNALGGQVLAHDTMFENQRIQADEVQSQLSEQQDQLKVIQNQLEIQHKLQEHILDILQTLAPNWTGPTTIVPVDTPMVHPVPSKNTPTEELSMQAEVPQDFSIKTKRPRGRPRTKCSRCREKRPLLGDTSLCEACVGLPVRLPKKRNLSLKRDASTSGSLSKQPRLDIHQDSRPRTDGNSVVYDPNEHNKTSIVGHRQEVQQGQDIIDIAFRSSRSENIHQKEVEDEIIVLSQPSEIRPDPSMNAQKPARKYRSSQSTVTAASSAPYNGPFFEGSGNRDTPLEDIVDHPLLDEISESGSTSSTHATSVAESISIDELTDIAIEDKALQDNSNTQLRLPNHRPYDENINQYDQLHHSVASRQAEHNVRSKDTIHASTTITTARVPQANMIALPRKQELNTGLDGSKYDSHHKLVQRVTGSAWKTANRRY